MDHKGETVPYLVKQLNVFFFPSFYFHSHFSSICLPLNTIVTKPFVNCLSLWKLKLEYYIVPLLLSDCSIDNEYQCGCFY